MAESVTASSRPSSIALADNRGPWRGLDDLQITTRGWVSWFNEKRLHSELGNRTPLEIEDEYGRLA